jgi:hypothetical protein
MKGKTLFALLIILSMLITSVGYAEDGALFLKNVSGTPDLETERANLNHMAFYVPMQNANGRILTEEDIAAQYWVDYTGDDVDKYIYETRLYAKPLVAVYIDSLEEEAHLGSGGAGIGAHDAYATVSLDDGHTWKATNLSNSSHLSSFTLENGEPFPGDAHNMTFALAGDKVLVGWISRYCDDGAPLYRFKDEDIVALQDAFGLPDLYVHDIWGVNGSQDSVDYTLQGFPEVGEIPYSCVWAARGQLLPVTLSPESDPHEGYDIVWLGAERLTSGVRDANRLEMNGDSAAGFMMTWQEDPDGLRPGLGLGPGEGWSGAVVWQDTDLWYSFISIDNFDKVVDSGGTIALAEAMPLGQYIAEGVETKPKYAVPISVPMRLTDNAKCMGNNNSPAYCYIDFDDENPWLTDLDLQAWETLGHSESSTFCTEVVTWDPPGDNQDSLELCQAEDGRVLGGRVGASRPRVNVQPYNSLFIVDDTDDTTWYDSAIVIMGAEESKALGSLEEELDVIEIGKNMMYYSFDLLNPSFVMQGGQLNWPAKNPVDGSDLSMLEDDFGNPFYDTEIARRFSHMSQAPHQIGESGASAVLIVKQGIINQGGPADIFLRLTRVPEDVVWEACEMDGDETTVEQCLPEGYNPYAYENLVCEDAEGNSMWEYTDGSNPRYIEGYCTSTGTNVSGVSSLCSGSDCGEFPWDGGVEFPKVTEWDQTVDNLDDESWENPWDVAKGHRGFIDGDFIMMMYAWSPNWKANAVGNDHYNLYARRSFDGGATWTTLPANYTHVDGTIWTGAGTTTCEYYGTGEDAVEDCTDYGPGDFEKARNLSQLTSNRETILDPRYTPTGGLKMLPVTDKFELSEELPYADDAVRDASKFFVVYETGDNTTVAEGEAVPMDLYYSRAYNWGDDYDLVERYDGTGDLVEEFDWLEREEDILSGEAANTCNPGGTFYYAIWNQWQEDEYENVSNSDAHFSRKMWLTDEVLESQDLLPRTSILYVSTDKADYEDPDIVLVGSARDTDRVGNIDPDDDGIDHAGWWVTIKEDSHYYEGRTFQSPPNGFIPGKHDFSFVAQDNEGNWSRPKTVTIWIAEKFYNIYLPTITR